MMCPMSGDGVSRRAFVFGSGGLLLTRRLGAQTSRPTVQQAVDRIRTNATAARGNNTSDGIKAGNPAVPLTGIAIVAMPTIDHLRRAAASGANLIVTPEPVFYSANDEAGPRATDAVYLAKKALIDRGGLVVYRFADQWNATPALDPAAAIAAALGWSAPAGSASGAVYPVAEMTLDTLKAKLRGALPLRGGLRTVGPPTLRVRSVFLSPGTTTLPATVAGLQRADVVIAGEPREWEAVPYVLDTAAAGHTKGMLLLGRVVSEGPSLRTCASWMAKLVPEVRVQALDADDPYWSAS